MYHQVLSSIEGYREGRPLLLGEEVTQYIHALSPCPQLCMAPFNMSL